MMKIKSLLFAALVLVGAAASAAGKDEPRTGMAVVQLKGSEVFKVIYKGQGPGKVKLNVYDSQSRVILRETFTGVDGFIVPLNFSGLPEGQYTIEVLDGAGRKVEKVTYEIPRLTPNIHIAPIRNAEGRYLLSVSNNQPSVISVQIFDADDKLLHSETKNIDGDFAQIYRVMKPSRHYTFLVSDSRGNTRAVKF